MRGTKPTNPQEGQWTPWCVNLAVSPILFFQSIIVKDENELLHALYYYVIFMVTSHLNSLILQFLKIVKHQLSISGFSFSDTRSC